MVDPTVNDPVVNDPTISEPTVKPADKVQTLHSSPTPENYTPDNKSPEEIEADIDRTRERISEDIDAITYKLSPQRIKDQAQGTIQGVQEAIVSSFQGATKDIGSGEGQTGIVDLIKANPLPATLIGLGVGLLAAGGAATATTGSYPDENDSYGASRYDSNRYDSNRYDSNRYVSGMSEKVSYNYSPGEGPKALPRPGQTSHESGITKWVSDYPLAAGVLGAVAGAVVGLALPGSRYEDEVMGQTSDQFIGEAKSKVGDVIDVAKETVGEVQSTVKQEFGQNTPSPDSAKEGVTAKAKSATSSVQEAAHNVVDTAKETAKQKAKDKGLISKS